jgi:hypothetical protein
MGRRSSHGRLCYRCLMLRLLRLFFGLLARSVSSHQCLLLENLALRQQIAVLQTKRPQARLGTSDKLFWVLLRRFWPDWKQPLILVQPETVVRWHRAGFKVYWRWLSRHRTIVGRKRIGKELRKLIFRMVTENPTWGSTASPRRTQNARLRYLRANRASVDA